MVYISLRNNITYNVLFISHTIFIYYLIIPLYLLRYSRYINCHFPNLIKFGQSKREKYI